jgi:molybdopterin converting factor small subunit
MKQVVGEKDRIITLNENATVVDLLRLVSMTYNGNLATLLFEDDKISIRNDVLVLINDAEINVLEGDKTTLSEGDEVALMPIAHGG